MFSSTSLPLRGKTALVTGVSRRRGIGYAVATQFARLGADVFIHHYSAHDADQPWGTDDLDAVRDGLRAELAPGARLGDLAADLRDGGIHSSAHRGGAERSPDTSTSWCATRRCRATTGRSST